MIMATKLKREQLRVANAPAMGKQASATRRRETRETKREAPRPEREQVTYRFDFANIQSIIIERDPLCFTIVVNPPKPNPGRSNG
jgi:hypothetical protein